MSKKDKASGNSNAKTSKKKRGGMSDVLHESVASAALDIFQKNSDFIVNSDEPCYIGLLLNVDDIGGLSKKDRRNEDKGQVIEAITAGHISAYISGDMLANEQIVFIPTFETIDRMNEYALLRSASYRVVLVNDDAEIQETDKTVTVPEIVEMYEDSSGVKLNDFMSSFASEGDSSDAGFVDDEFDEFDVEGQSPGYTTPSGVPQSVDYEVPSPVDTASATTDYEGPAFGDDVSAPAGDSSAAPSGFQPTTVATPSEGETLPYADFGDNDPYADMGSGYGGPYADDVPPYGDEPDNDEEEEAVIQVVGDEEALMDTIVRRFYSDDLGLEVSTEPFDIQFLKSDTVVPFDENRPAGWLNDYLNQRSVEANTELRHMHAQNLQALRERYLTLVALHCERIERDLDLESEESRYGKRVRDIMSEARDEMKGLSRLVSAKKDDINKDWNEKLDEAAAQAAEDARREYISRFGDTHQAQLLRVEPDIKQQIDQKATERKRGLYEDRRREAARLLDVGINEILVELSGMHANMVMQENQRRHELQQDLQDFVDDHRKDEIARSQALAEELAQSQKADRVAKEYAEKMAAQTAEFKAKREVDLAEIARIRENSDEILADKDAQNRQTTEALQSQIAELKADNAKLMENYVNLDKKRSAEYEGRIAQLTNDKAAVEDSLTHVRATHKRSSRMAIIAAIIAAIATLAVGLVVGYYSGTHVADDVVNKVDEQYRSQIPSEAATIALETMPSNAQQPKTQG